MREGKDEVTELILDAWEKAARETTKETRGEFTTRKPIQWPVSCTVGPGLEGAIACESKVGYVNGAKGWLIYRGYDIFDLCARCSFEEVSYLLLKGKLPNASELQEYKGKLFGYSFLNKSLRLLMGFPVEKMNTMGALRLGTILMRQEFTTLDLREAKRAVANAIGSDEDSIPMETPPTGEARAVYEFPLGEKEMRESAGREEWASEAASGLEACCHLIAGVASVTAAIARLRQGLMPLAPDPELSHAANFLYMMTGRRPTPLEERVMDIALILHADHGMNASTFAAMVVASTLSDAYFSVGAAVAALNGPLHGGANEQVIRSLAEIGEAENVKGWVEQARSQKRKVAGFGHRVYKVYDPRARILGPLAGLLVKEKPKLIKTLEVAKELEREVLASFGREKKIFPNVDFYSGIVYSALGLSTELFTPVFASSRVAGWTARVLEYLQKNRIFRPRAIYVGGFGERVTPIEKRS